MLDIRLIREQPDLVRDNLAKRGMDLGRVQEITDIDERRRSAITKANALKKERNDVAMHIRDAKSSGIDVAPEIEACVPSTET
jgi:seryl-tRNA synthetase